VKCLNIAGGKKKFGFVHIVAFAAKISIMLKVEVFNLKAF
jgi:hypothetical protein